MSETPSKSEDHTQDSDVHTPPPRRRGPTSTEPGASPFTSPRARGAAEAAPTLGGYGDHVLRDVAVMVEYNRLKKELPSGIVVVPESGRLRRWYGTVFIRQGAYNRGIWPFVINIPPSYPSNGHESVPELRFRGTPPFHPLVDPRTGRLSVEFRLGADGWDMKRHRLRHIVRLAKEIFFLPFEEMDRVSDVSARLASNLGAASLWLSDREAFVHRASSDAAISLREVVDGKFSTPVSGLPLTPFVSHPKAVDLKSMLLREGKPPTSEEILAFLSDKK